MKNTGIWIDKDKAHMFSLEGNKTTFLTITSDIDFYKIKANKTLGGSTEIVKDRTHLEREKQQLKSYFKNIISVIEDSDAIVIFGPAQTGQKLNKEIELNYKILHPHIKEVIKTDQMTENQTKAWVRNYFNN